jgi:hypothetical protein
VGRAVASDIGLDLAGGGIPGKFASWIVFSGLVLWLVIEKVGSELMIELIVSPIEPGDEIGVRGEHNENRRGERKKEIEERESKREQERGRVEESEKETTEGGEEK